MPNATASRLSRRAATTALPARPCRSGAPAALPEPHRSFFFAHNWDLVHSETRPARAAVVRPFDTLALHPAAIAGLRAAAPALWRHQHIALRAWSRGHHVLLTTGTASGKTLVFVGAALDLLARDPEARVLVFSPAKALSGRLFEAFTSALAHAGLAGTVARLDGDNSDFRTRLAELRPARIVVATPDAFHAGLLSRLEHPQVRKFLASLRLVVLDEAHSYTGAFGTQAAYFLRRLRFHLARLGATGLRLVAASATLAAPRRHLSDLTGLQFAVVGPRADGAPRHLRHLHLVRPPAGADLFGELSELLGAWAAPANGCEAFAVFCASRRLSETVADCANRGHRPPAADDAWPHHLDRRIGVYRAGFTAPERREIEAGLADGRLRGLVCTSALELGVDFPRLTSGLLLGVPASLASFRQRLGRFGRHAAAHIFVVHDGTPATEDLFREPVAWFARSDPDSCLYLENPRVLARQALCLRAELDAHPSAPPPSWEDFFPPAFRAEFAALRRGEPSAETREELGHATEPPHRAFSLRDLDRTFAIRHLGNAIGSLTFAQALREAYPGAIYLHNGTRWRVASVDLARAEIRVDPERRYASTQPAMIPAQLTPDLAEGRLVGWHAAALAAAEARCEVRECVTGYTERCGAQLATVDYRDRQHRWLTRQYSTTGVILAHPAIQDDAFDATAAAELVKECLLFLRPLDGREIGTATGRLLAARLGLPLGTRYLAVYDETRGSLRLSRPLADPTTLSAVLARAALLAAERGLAPATVAGLQSMATSATAAAVPLPPETEGASAATAFAAGERALHTACGEIVVVLSIQTDLDGHLRYEVRRERDGATGTLPAEKLSPLPVAA